MATLVPQALEELFQEFKGHDLSINKDVIQVTGLLPTDIILKCAEYQWPCVIYSCSFLYAKLIMSLTEEMTHIMKKANNSASLRFAFNPYNSKERLRFFVPGKIKGTKRFKIKEKMAFLVNFEYNSKPPDDLIELFGIVYRIKKFYNVRKDQRIPITDKTVYALGLTNNKIMVTIDNIPRTCIIRDLSHSGIKVIMSCNPKFIMNKEMDIILPFVDNTTITIRGIIIRYEELQGRKDIYFLGVKFIEEKIPLIYTNRIENFLTQIGEMKKKKNIS